MHKKILMSLLLITSIVYGNKLEPHCFENDFMLLNDKIKIEKITIYFKDSYRKDEEAKYSRLFYTLKNGHTHVIEDLFCSYDVNASTYFCSIECDGGVLEYDTKNKVMYMEDLRSYEEVLILPPDMIPNPNEIKKLDNPEKGWLDTGILENKHLKYNEKVWVYENDCSTSEEPKTTQVYYTEDEYISTFPTKTKRDEYFDELYKPLVYDEDDYRKVQNIKLKKSYKSVAMMMKTEGFALDLFENYDIGLFIYNNQRALVHVGNLLPKGVSGCISVGYYLLELNGRDLKVRSFGWESGSVSVVTVFEQEPVVVVEKTN